MAVGTATSSPQHKDTSPNLTPLLAFSPVSVKEATPPPTLEQCKMLRKEITDAHTNYKLLAAGAGLALGGTATAIIGGFSTILGGIVYINNRLQDRTAGLWGNDPTSITLLAAGITFGALGVATSFTGIIVASLGALGLNNPTSYFRAQWGYNTGGCRRILAEAEQTVADTAPNSSRIVIETSDTIPATINTPPEYPPMPAPWKVAAAHMMHDVGQSLQNAGQQLADDIVPIALTGAAIVVGLAALETGNTTPLQRAFGY